ncbi:MAG TPA: DUF6228 family protein [Candidatus Dormibacteraeota bacterium]|nr:DUF6228 family protein [Candidatus Dormibacteraeota bacterium]
MPETHTSDPGEGAVLRLICSEAGTHLVLHPPMDPYGDGNILRFRAELLAPGLTADSWVKVINDHGLAAVFDRLVAGWHGWEGELAV